MELPSLDALKKSLEAPHKQSAAKAKEDRILPWKEFSSVLAPKIRRILRHILGDTDEAVTEDLTSQVFTWVVKTLKNEPFKFVNMQHLEARTILKARSMAIDYLRHEIKSPIVQTNSDASIDTETWVEKEQTSFENKYADHRPNPAEEALDQDLSDILLNLLGKIKQKHREVLKMIILEGKTHQEAADALGMPIGAIGSYRERGINEIKKEIGRRPHLLKDLTDKYGKLQLTFEIAILALLLK